MLNIDIDDKALLADLKAIPANQAPFAISLGLNTVTSGARDHMRTLVPKEFTIASSREKFLVNLIRFPKSAWARKDKLFTVMGVHSSDGDVGVGSSNDRGFLLGRHEDGGVRERLDPLRPFFIPTDEIRGGDRDLPPRSLYPTALRLMEGRGIVSYTTTVDKKTGKTKRKGVRGNLLIQSRTTKNGKIQILGKQHTFLLNPLNAPGEPNKWGIYQRTGPGRRDLRMIWAFRSRITLPDRLHFYQTIGQYVDANIADAMATAIDRALATARR